MACSIRLVKYFYATAKDAPGEAYSLLSTLAASEVNLLAFSAIPTGPAQAQFTLFPEDPDRLALVAQRANIPFTGPHHAFLIQGDDRLGALAEIHRALVEARINVYATNGIADGRGGFGYLVYVRAEDTQHAEQVLQRLCPEERR
jgi:hypothetical protein